MASALVALATTTLASSSADIVFSGISGSYRDLRLVATNIGLASSQQMAIRINGDGGNNYSRVGMVGTGTGTNSPADSNISYITLTGANFTANGQLGMDFMDYSATDKHKTVLSRYSNAGVESVAVAGRWASTSAITSIQFLAFTINFAAGSTFSLYGVTA